MKIQSQLYGNIKQFIRERIKFNELYRRYLTFTFTMDAFPDYTRFDHTKKVLAAIQIIKTAGAKELYRTKTVHDPEHEDFFI